VRKKPQRVNLLKSIYSAGGKPHLCSYSSTMYMKKKKMLNVVVAVNLIQKPEGPD